MPKPTVKRKPPKARKRSGNLSDHLVIMTGTKFNKEGNKGNKVPNQSLSLRQDQEINRAMEIDMRGGRTFDQFHGLKMRPSATKPKATVNFKRAGKGMAKKKRKKP